MKNISKIMTIGLGISMLISNPSIAKKTDSASYYDLFKFKVLGDCSKIDTVKFKEADSWKAAFLGSDENGRPLVASLSIQLMDGGKYFANYNETTITKGLPDMNNEGYTSFSKQLIGIWMVSGEQLILSSLGVGTPSTYQEHDGSIHQTINFQINVVMNNPKILSTSMTIGQSITNVPSDGRTINQFCGVIVPAPTPQPALQPLQPVVLLTPSAPVKNERCGLSDGYITMDSKDAFYFSSAEDKMSAFTLLVKSGVCMKGNRLGASESYITMDGINAFYFSSAQDRVNAVIKLQKAEITKFPRCGANESYLTYDGKSASYFSDSSKKLDALLGMIVSGLCN